MAPVVAEVADRDTFFEDMRGLNSESVALLPTHLDENGAGFDLDLLEAKDNAFESFPKLLDYCNKRFSIHMLGQNLTTEISDKGSRAAADTHRGVERTKATADAKKLTTALRMQVVLPWFAFNHGGSLEDAPWPRWKTEPPEDLKGRAEGQKTFGMALGEIGKAGFEVENVEELGEEYGLKLKPKEVAEPPGGNAVPPPAPPGGSPPTKEGDEEDEDDESAELASGDRARGALNGQLYADELADNGRKTGQRVIAPDLAKVLAIVDAAEDYDGLREALSTAFPDMKPKKFSELLEKSLVLADLAGRHAVLEDV